MKHLTTDSNSALAPEPVEAPFSTEFGRHIKFHTPEEFEAMRKAGRLAAEVLDFIAPKVVPGVTTGELDDLCHQFIIDRGALPAPLNYRGFPKSICTSVNHVICHGIPGPKVLKEGDILNIDITVILEGWHGDTSRMFSVGSVSRKAERLIEVTYEAMMRGIAAAQPGNTLGDIGCSVVRDFCGHGLGRVFHDAPNILHYGRPGQGMTIRPGMFFTVEPMINLGKYHVRMLNDGWTAVTRDKSLSAQFEHSIGITENGPEIFTKSPAGLDKPPYF
jgi:methionyl aminopeptidase